MHDKEIDRKQQKRLLAFDKELFSYTGEIAWFIPSIVSFCILGFIAIPFQEFNIEDRSMFFIITSLSVQIPVFVLQPYTTMTDSLSPRPKKQYTHELLQYLPVSKHQYRMVRMHYLFRYFWKLAAIGLVLQCITSILSNNMGLENIFYVLVMLFFLPMLSGWLQLLLNNVGTGFFMAIICLLAGYSAFL